MLVHRLCYFHCVAFDGHLQDISSALQSCHALAPVTQTVRTVIAEDLLIQHYY